LIPCNDQHKNGDIVAEAVLAGENIKKFPHEQGLALLAADEAVVAYFAKNLLMGDGP
jgi:hypothetical protein